MPFGWFARRYVRTCRECGYSWEVPRSIARRGVRGIAAVSVVGATEQPGGFAELESGIAARAEAMESYRICAKCGVDDFTQRPVRGS